MNSRLYVQYCFQKIPHCADISTIAINCFKTFKKQLFKNKIPFMKKQKLYSSNLYEISTCTNVQVPYFELIKLYCSVKITRLSNSE